MDPLSLLWLVLILFSLQPMVQQQVLGDHLTLTRAGAKVVACDRDAAASCRLMILLPSPPSP